MPKLSLDETFWSDPKLADLCQRMGGWPKTQAIGTLALFWHRTREAKLCLVPPRTLQAYLPVDPTIRIKLLNALVLSGWLVREGELLEVVGNAAHLKMLERRRRAGVKGRAATILLGKAKLDAERKGAKPVTKRPRPKKDAALVPTSAAQDANRQTWQAYSEAYIRRWEVEPTRNARVNALVAQFVQRVGQADAPAVAMFYVEHPDVTYVRAMHTLQLAVRDAEGLHAQWQRGAPVTQQTAQQGARACALQMQLEDIRQGRI